MYLYIFLGMKHQHLYIIEEVGCNCWISRQGLNHAAKATSSTKIDSEYIKLET